MWRLCYQEEPSPDLPLPRQTDGTIHLQCATNSHRCEKLRAIATGVLHQEEEALEGLAGEVGLTMIATFPEDPTRDPDHQSVAVGRDHTHIHDHRRALHPGDGEEAQQQEVLHEGAEAQATAHTVVAAEAGAGVGREAEIGVEVGDAGGPDRMAVVFPHGKQQKRRRWAG